MTDAWPVAQAEVQAAPVESPEEFIKRRDIAIGDWLHWRKSLETIKTTEMEARNTVSQMLFPSPKKGTQRYPLNAGYSVKLVHVLNYSLGDKDKLNDAGEKVSVNDQVEAVITEIDALGEVAQLLGERLLKFKYELSVTEYEALDLSNPIQLQVRNLVDKLITVKPGSPQLTFEEPKTK